MAPCSKQKRQSAIWVSDIFYKFIAYVKSLEYFLHVNRVISLVTIAYVMPAKEEL